MAGHAAPAPPQHQPTDADTSDWERCEPEGRRATSENFRSCQVGMGHVAPLGGVKSGEEGGPAGITLWGFA